MFWEDDQKQKYYEKGHINVLAASSKLTDPRQQMPDRCMWSADVAGLSADGWQLSKDAVSMQFRRLVPSVLRDTLWSSTILTSAYHHTQFVLAALRHIKPVEVGM